MKHPVLTRMIAVMLALLCGVMLLAGLGIGRKTAREWKNAQANVQRLSERTQEYRAVLDALSARGFAGENGDAVSAGEQAHESASARHRAALAAYTATRGGVQAGMAAMDQAESMMQMGKQAYEEGRRQFDEQAAAFEEGYRQFQEGKEKLALGMELMGEAETALSAAEVQLASLRGMSELMDSGEEDARLGLSVAAYDQMLSAYDAAFGLLDRLEQRGGLSEEELSMIVSLIGEQTGQDVGDLQLPALTPEMLEQIRQSIQSVSGMTPEELRAKIQQERDALASREGEEPLSEEEYEAVRAAYLANRAAILQALAAAEEQVASLSAQVAEAKAQMVQAQAQMAEMDEYMEQAKAAIEQGRAALDQAGVQLAQGEAQMQSGRAQLYEQQRKLEEERLRLEGEKAALESGAAVLRRLDANAKALQELQDQENSLRLMLLGWDSVKLRVSEGEKLLPAAVAAGESLLDEAREQYHGRSLTALLMLIAAVFGLATIPAAFEKTKSRLWLFLPAFLCMALAAAAEVLCERLGRGSSYSALAAAGFALVLLLIGLPREKKYKAPTA